MSTNRELLTLAAKALGIPLAWSSMEDLSPRRTDTWVNWNPGEDDGDCARMEAALGITVRWHDDCAVAHLNNGSIWTVCEFYKDHGGDRNAARRLASLRLAAEIVKAMP